jgi:hypothetical protein
VGEFLNQFGSMTPSPYNSDAPITANSAMPLTLVSVGFQPIRPRFLQARMDTGAR